MKYCSSNAVQPGGVLHRVGRVLVRKLVLRGYNVRVLARNKAQVAGILPSSVGIVEGDVGSPQTLREAVEGVDKARHLPLPGTRTPHCPLRACSLALWAAWPPVRMAAPCAVLPAPVRRVWPATRCRSGLLALQIVYCARAEASTVGDAQVVEEQGPARLAQELQVGHLHLHPPLAGEWQSQWGLLVPEWVLKLPRQHAELQTCLLPSCPSASRQRRSLLEGYQLSVACAGLLQEDIAAVCRTPGTEQQPRPNRGRWL